MNLAPGTRLGPYEIVAPLGAGGMGEVYLAKDTRLGREVAIKVLPAAVASDPERLRRFEQEAKAVSALNHPHIVTLHELGQSEHGPYLVLEKIEGQSLRELLRDGAVPVKRVLTLGAQIAEGLAKAHGAGIVHRDLKPENVMVTADGFAKILDFGLAKLVYPELEGGAPHEMTTLVEKTGTGMILGTLGYLSPEQAVGKPADFRSDQFALGALLYELATGERPFHRATTPESLTAVIREEPEPLQKRNAAVPAQLGWIVERCLSKDPNDRYASTRDLAHDLGDLRDHLSEISRVEVEVSSAPRSLAMRAGLLGAAGVLGVACGIALTILLRPAPPAVMVQSRFLSHSGADSSPAVSPDLGTIAFTSSRDGRRRIWLKQLSTGAEAPLTEGSDDFPRFSPDGSQVLFVRGSGGDEALFRVPSLGGEPRRILSDVRFADWSPDGKSIAFLSSRFEGDTSLSILGRVAPDGSGAEEIVRFPGRLLLHPRWSPDGREVALVERANQSGSASTLEIVDLGTRRSRSVWSAIGMLSSPAWTPSGRELIVSRAASVTAAVTSSDGWIHRVNLSSGEPTRLAWLATSGRSLDLAGPGRVVIDTESPRQNLLALEREEKGPRVDSWLTHGNSSDRQPTFSPDGEWVLFSSDRGGNLDLWKVSVRSGAVRRVTDDDASDWDPAFTPDGRILWSSNRSGTYEIWQAESDGSAAHQLTRIGHAENPIASPDGNWMVFVSVAPGREGLWRTRADGSEPIRLVTQYAVLPEISPDGAVVSFVSDFGSERHSIRAVALASGAPAELAHRPRVSVSLGQGLSLGRHRWLPDGHGLIYLGLDDRDRSGLYELEFDRSLGAATPSPYFGFEPDRATESFALSPDGKRLVVAQWEQQRSLLLVDGIPSIEPGGKRR